MGDSARATMVAKVSAPVMSGVIPPVVSVLISDLLFVGVGEVVGDDLVLLTPVRELQNPVPGHVDDGGIVG